MQNTQSSLSAVWKNGALPEPWAPIAHQAEELQSAFADTSNDYLDFLQKRSSENIKLLRRLVTCKTPWDVFSAYQSFLSQASRDYQEEYSALAESGKKALDNVVNGHGATQHLAQG
ncbi:phasin family protein [Hyphomicrobium sp.]|uniref:phasin family protein n=1 Tax=Hyphomicrobium sp. TaxID=82 RepID=UPI002E3337F4|nr:phasin family protein [Hyphomicrobium sp.]HEX2842096.1 phasin family protein [Hyphomicrobium sp.]